MRRRIRFWREAVAAAWPFAWGALATAGVVGSVTAVSLGSWLLGLSLPWVSAVAATALLVVAGEGGFRVWDRLDRSRPDEGGDDTRDSLLVFVTKSIAEGRRYIDWADKMADDELEEATYLTDEWSARIANRLFHFDQNLLAQYRSDQGFPDMGVRSISSHRDFLMRRLTRLREIREQLEAKA